MHWAAILRSSEVMKMLLEKGAYVCLKDGCEHEPMLRKPTKDWSPIHAAIEGKGVDLVRVLPENGAEQMRMWEGRTPLHIVVQNDRKELFEMLIKNGADLQAISVKDQTPIELAYALEREDLVEEMGQTCTRHRPQRSSTRSRRVSID